MGSLFFVGLTEGLVVSHSLNMAVQPFTVEQIQTYHFRLSEASGSFENYAITDIRCQLRNNSWGSCGGSVGRAVASDTRGPRFESQHWQIVSTNCTFK